MGNFIRRSFAHLTVTTNRDALSRTECHDSDVIKKIWQAIDQNSAYYGFAFCTLLFENHPQYAKYFEEETVPEFVQEAKMKKKFTVIYDIVCALFIDFQDKPVQKKYLLGYIAMVHKDMGLTLQDFKNFMSDLLETLTKELPHMMSEEYILIQMSYLNDIAAMLPKLMEDQQKRLQQIQTPRVPSIKKCCAWRRNPQSQMIYGLPLKYWLYKKRYWEYRRAIWRSTAKDSVEPVTPTVARNKGNMSIVRRKPIDARKNPRRRQLKTKSRDKSVNYDSETSTESEGVRKRVSRVIKKKQFQRRVHRSRRRSSGFSPMETIQEDTKIAAGTSSPKVSDVSHGYNSKVSKSGIYSLNEDTAKVNNTARERRRESKMPYVRS